MNEEKCKEQYNKLVLIHEKVATLVEIAGIKGDILNEYRGKVNQYIDMLASLDNMIEFVDTDEAKSKLYVQKISVIDKWIQFELRFSGRITEQ